MRKIRVTVCLFFVVSCVVFGIYMVKTKMVEDHTPPVITCEDDTIELSVSAEPSELLKGITAKDDRDGDITDSVLISSMSHFIGKGKRTVTYIVFDKANQAATLNRTVIYTDYTSPKIRLTKPLRYNSDQAMNANFMENLSAEDCLDGDISGQARMVKGDSYYTAEPGEYPVTLQVSNSAGDVRSLPVSLVITDSKDHTEAAKCYPMLSEYIVYTKVGQSVDAASYLTGLVRNGAELSFAEDAGLLKAHAEDVSISSNVDYENPGVYTIAYSYTSEAGVTAVTKLYVVVEE